jgi:hydrogenase nickel incorporation protein HypA/HybF
VHELSLTVGVVDAVVERLGETKVTALRLEIGRLSGVVVDSVRFCFDLVAAGTSVEGARLEIDEPPGRGRCRRCGREFDMPGLLAPCPCGSVEMDLVGGQELRITGVEVAR